MDCRVEIPAVLDRRVTLPPSKSIAVRVLVINALVGGSWNVERGTRKEERLSAIDDIDVMAQALASDSDCIDVGGTGTAMRFLTAYFACQEGRTVTLDGSGRMRQRPIGPLVDALRQMGASIDYLGNEGFPPLKIEGRQLRGGSLTMRGDVSSQFVSALLMIAPVVGGITLTLDGAIVSRPYIDMTLALLRRHGIEARIIATDNKKTTGFSDKFDFSQHTEIVVNQQKYKSENSENSGVYYDIEGDWSAASYWFALKALLPQSRIVLSPLTEHSIQGDRAIVEIMAPLGVTARFLDGGEVLLSSHIAHPDTAYCRDMAATPDLVPTLAVTLCLLRVPFTLTGVATLRLKESDRLMALREELVKLGYAIEVDDNSLSYDGNHEAPQGGVVLDPHGDHRMAMALSLAATRHPGITIKDAEVVTKSYPQWWKELINAQCTMHNS